MLHAAIESFYSALSAWGYSHPLHPTQVHLVIGLSAGAFIFQCLGILRIAPHFFQSARHCFLLAFVFFFPTVLFGFTDWQRFYSGALLPPIQTKIALAGLLIIFLLAGVRIGRAEREKSAVTLGIYFMTLLTVGGMGYFGGSLVYGDRSAAIVDTYGKGQSLYAAHCGGCHPNGGNSITPGRPVKGSSTLSDFKVFLQWIRHPAALMPPFPETVLSDAEARELYGYITHVIDK
jgi:cytochrome c6